LHRNFFELTTINVQVLQMVQLFWLVLASMYDENLVTSSIKLTHDGSSDELRPPEHDYPHR
jgi:hypothetical protein